MNENDKRKPDDIPSDFYNPFKGRNHDEVWKELLERSKGNWVKNDGNFHKALKGGWIKKWFKEQRDKKKDAQQKKID